MPINAFEKEQEHTVPTAYKDPLSAKIIAGLAIFWLVVGIVTFIYGIYNSTTINSRMSVYSGYMGYGSILGTSSFILYFAAAIGSFLISALLFVLYNMACDIHRTEYNIRILTGQNQKNHNQTIKQLQYIDDSITRQSNVIIRQQSNNKNASPEKRKPEYEINAHDGSF